MKTVVHLWQVVSFRNKTQKYALEPRLSATRILHQHKQNKNLGPPQDAPLLILVDTMPCHSSLAFLSNSVRHDLLMQPLQVLLEAGDQPTGCQELALDLMRPRATGAAWRGRRR